MSPLPTAASTRIRSLALGGLIALTLVACGEPADPAVTGYVEAIYLRPAPAIGGRITQLLVDRGTQVKAGAPLFVLDAEREQAAVAEAQHRVDALNARLADLGKGRRPQEIAVIRAQLAQARAQQGLSQASERRQTELSARQLVSADVLDTARSAAARDSARVAELQHQLAVAELAGRDDALKAAREDVASAESQLAQAQWALAQKSVTAPADARVEDVYFRAGEWVNAGTPVLALLPPANRRLRFFVPQARLAEFAPGREVQARCDGCETAVSAAVHFVAAEAEFAPPVLFDRHQRSRLVYRVEALPAPEDALRLHPGQPVDVTVAPP